MRRIAIGALISALILSALATASAASRDENCGHRRCKPTTTTSISPATTSTVESTATTAAPTTSTTIPTTPGPIIDCQGGSRGSTHLAFVTGAVIRNCVFIDADVQLYRTDHTRVLNNTFISTDGIEHNSALIISDFDTYGLIDGNTIDAGGTYDDSIVLDYADGTQVTNNTVNGTYDCGIEFVDTIRNVLIDGNDVTSGGQCGIGGWFNLSMFDSQITNNALHGPSQYGIYLTMKSGSSANLISGNTGGPVYYSPSTCCSSATLLAAAADPISYTLTVDNPAPAHGDSVIFSGTFPQAAFKQSRQPQYPGNPAFSLNCGNSEETVMRYFISNLFHKDSKNADGSWNATATVPILLDSAGGFTWLADALGVVCHAFTGYWTQDCAKCGPTWNPVADLTFTVDP